MRGIVWYETFQQGCDKLDEIITNYKLIGIEPENIIKTRYNYRVFFKNNDIWSVAPLNTNSRSKNCNISYIPFGMKDSEIIDFIVYPSTKSMPYQAVHFY